MLYFSNHQKVRTKYKFIYVYAYSWKYIERLVYGFCTWITLYIKGNDYKKMNNASAIAKLLFQKVVCLHKVSKTITCNQ